MHWYVSEDREGERRRGKIGAGGEREANEEKAERMEKEGVIHSTCSSGLLQLLFA